MVERTATTSFSQELGDPLSNARCRRDDALAVEPV